MAKKKGLSVRELKRICDLIGKKGKDGKPVTKSEIRRWKSVKKQVGRQKSRRQK